MNRFYRRRKCITIAFALLLLGFCACDRGIFSSQQIEHPDDEQSYTSAVPSVSHIIKSTYELPASVETEIIETPIDNIQFVGNGTIILFRNIVAGDYCIYHLHSDGQVEYTCFIQENLIASHGQGKLKSENIQQLFMFVQDRGLYQLKSEYDIYPLESNNTKVYEDIYYWLKIKIDRHEDLSVMAHEKAMPENMIEIIKAINDIMSEIPNSPVSGSYLLAGESEMLLHKRNLDGLTLLEFDKNDIITFPELAEVLQNQYSLIPIDNPLEPQLSVILNSGNNIIEVLHEGNRYAVLLLKPLE